MANDNLKNSSVSNFEPLGLDLLSELSDCDGIKKELDSGELSAIVGGGYYPPPKYPPAYPPKVGFGYGKKGS